jgi:hypothetical protein
VLCLAFARSFPLADSGTANEPQLATAPIPAPQLYGFAMELSKLKQILRGFNTTAIVGVVQLPCRIRVHGLPRRRNGGTNSWGVWIAGPPVVLGDSLTEPVS